MKRMAVLTAVALATGCQPVPEGGTTPDDAAPSAIAGVFDGSSGHWVDLTHAFSESTVYWPTDTIGFVHEELAYGPTEAGFFYSSYRFESAEHGGTHLDAPIHFAEGRRTADEIPLSDLIGPAAVIDVSERAHPDYLVSVADLQAWESEHGPIPGGAIVLVRTGWDARWGDQAAYLGTELTGPEAVPALHFPGLDPEAARWLVENRDIVALGLDTPSLDYGQSTDYATHVILNSQNIAGFENLANLGELPPTGAYVVALPMKIEGGSGGPLRIVAFVPGAAGG